MPEETQPSNTPIQVTPTQIGSPPIDALRPPPPTGWREGLAGLRSRVELSVARLALCVVVALGVAVGAFLVLRQPPVEGPEVSLPMAGPISGPTAGTVPIEPAPDWTGPPGEVIDEESGETGERGEVVVHAAGAVVAPGLYRLSGGARVDDVVLAAGGPAHDAQLERLNLAAPVVDGERVYVPRVGEAVPAPVTPTPAAAGDSDVGGTGPAPVDLNSATASELDTLPGVGPATAAAIIAYREASGGFRSVEELLDVRGIGDVKLAELRDLVTV